MIESAPNQYAPPVATVQDVAPPAPAAELRYFSAEGRIGRLRYLAYSIGASLLHGAIVGLLTAILGSTIGTIVSLASVLVLMWFTILCGIKRCHDLDLSGWWSVTVIIPIISLIWIFVPGSKGANRFGPPPPPNTLGVRLLAFILPAVFIIGVVAAVALPAYSAYVAKARAAQAASQGSPSSQP
ncbi:DUF805 domain-containing protein [Roseateles amylovorans]|uniref:DUF805 domain-containing protein n=1 Tax=Roseateles amylovorans TaxID=2978473 RepID=A0ABY6B8U5_9BURK|nr:DUF805 domain-containing protein [Roseateles amylovorans]UXH79642.1 DUF805 domain-containing protein [Roseateles amylovorans]